MASNSDNSEKPIIKKNVSKAGLPVLNVGNPGNKGGPGRPPSALRAMSREGYDMIAQRIIQAIEENKFNASDLNRAADIMAKYGLGEAKVIVPEEMIEAVSDVLGADMRIPSECIPDVARELEKRLKGLG